MATTVLPVETPYEYDPMTGIGGTVTGVDMFWDNSTRLWIIFRVNDRGEQLGSADYAPRRTEALDVAKAMARPAR